MKYINNIYLTTLLALAILIPMSMDAQRGEDFETLVDDGTWCWFSDPRAVYHDGHRTQTYTGYISSTGDVQVTAMDHKTGHTETAMLYENFEVDDHDNPSLLVLPDGRLMVFFTKHGGQIYYSTTSTAEDISSFAPVDSMDLGRRLCYTNPVLLSAEDDRIYLFFRGGENWKPSYITSDDLGKTWSAPKVIVSRTGSNNMNRPYTKVVSDGESKIHFAFTDGHPRLENHNSIYYLRYEDGAFYDAAGAKMGGVIDLPLAQESLPKAFDGVAENKRAWIWDIAVDGDRPVIAYTTLPEETSHYYHYGYWDGSVWQHVRLTDGGSAFPRIKRNKSQRDPEPHYSGGIAIDHDDPTQVYLSRPHGDRYEIEHWDLSDVGAPVGQPLTQASLHDNIRPFVVRGAPDTQIDRVQWLSVDEYVHYTDYHTAIKTSRPAERYTSELDVAGITTVMGAVADWQIDHFHEVKHHLLDWTNGALYTGMMAWAKIAGKDKYLKWLQDIGWKYKWQPYYRMYHADDIVVSQMYLDMYEYLQDEDYSYRILGPTKARTDYVVSHPSEGTLYLDYGDAQTLERWSWCDALFMAPPVYVKMYNITGDEKYLDFMHEEFLATYEFLYDEIEHLFYRDYRFFPSAKREANGEKIFWGRGNGWVMGGLVSILRDLPEDAEIRPFYEQLFIEMAEKVADCQDDSGYWHASMLDHGSFPNPETSSTGFFCYALAYGVNAGLLDRDTYGPRAIKAWEGLVQAVYADGKLGWVQPIGEDPKDVTAQMTEVYGVGAFLLAGSEILQLVGE